MTPNPKSTGPFSPEEFQRQLTNLWNQHLNQFSSNAPPKSDSSTEATAGPTDQPRPVEFEFSLKPRDVKAHLDRFVIKQDEAKKVLSVAICDHYHHVRLAAAGKAQPNYAKQNVILTGPTGVGKTYLVRSIADLIGVPFVKGDATKFSETGYVGGDVEDLVRELLRKADGDAERAQYGIIYIDEIDKIATASNAGGRDVSGRGVQTNLLKLMEETDVPARAPQDIAGQVQAMLDLQRGRKSAATLNTKHILFIVSGAFDGLDKIIRRRLREAVIGFSSKPHLTDSDSVLDQAQTRDFLEFGFEPEFIGRLPVRVVCHPLNEEELFQILKSSEGSIIRQYEQTFSAYGIEVLFQDDALRLIAQLAATEQTGARGLMTVCERVFREFKYELPSTQVKRLVVSRDLVASPVTELKQLLAESRHEAQAVSIQVVHEFAARLSQSHGFSIRFTDLAAERLVARAAESDKSVRDLCADNFKDLHFGLKLIANNTGQSEFLLDETFVDAPERVLSDWVVTSYRGKDGPTPS